MSKNEKPKPAAARFFILYFRKFWDLAKLNLLYFVCCILFYIPVLIVLLGGGFGSWVYYVSILPIILTGPFTAGFMHVLRDFTRERPAFIWSDFKDAARQNWKQAVSSMAIAVCGTGFLVFIFNFYHSNLKFHSVFYFPIVLVILFGLLFLFMHYYVFVMLVTFDLSLKNIYKNAMIFAFLGLGRNLLITVCIAAVMIITFLLPILSFLLIFITLSTVGFLISFAVWPLVKKYLIDTHPEFIPKEKKVEAIFTDKEHDK